MTPELTHLISILARTDGLWLPMRARDWQSPVPSVIYEARRDFVASGVCYSTGGSTEAGRKADQRVLRSLADAGLLRLGRRKRQSARLTDLGDHFGRALCALPTAVDAHGLLRRTIELNDVAVREIWLLNEPNYICDDPEQKARIMGLEDRLFPALWRGWVESSSDTAGRVWYSATDLGREVAAEPAPALPGKLPEPNLAACRLWAHEMWTYRLSLRAAQPERPSEIGPIPCSAASELQPRYTEATD